MQLLFRLKKMQLLFLFIIKNKIKNRKRKYYRMNKKKKMPPQNYKLMAKINLIIYLFMARSSMRNYLLVLHVFCDFLKTKNVFISICEIFKLQSLILTWLNISFSKSLRYLNLNLEF